MLYALFRLLHLIALVALAGAIIIQNMAIAKRVSTEDLNNLGKLNRVVAISAAIVVLLGLILWLGVGKPAAFYNSNPLFHAKLGLVVVLAALSAPVTVFLRRGRQVAPGDDISVPRGVRLALRGELALLLLIAVLAGLMARGIGLNFEEDRQDMTQGEVLENKTRRGNLANVVHLVRRLQEIDLQEIDLPANSLDAVIVAQVFHDYYNPNPPRAPRPCWSNYIPCSNLAA